MKEGKGDLLLLSGEDVVEKGKRKGEDGEDVMVDVVDEDGGGKADLSLKVGVNGARDEVMEEATSEDERKDGNAAVVEDTKMDLERLNDGNEVEGEKEVIEEIVERTVVTSEEVTVEKIVKETGEEVTVEKIVKETEVLSSSKIMEVHVVAEDKIEDGVKNEGLSTDVVKKRTEDDKPDVSGENVESQVGVDETSKESMQSEKDSKMAVESLFTEPHVQEVADLDLVANEKDAGIEASVDGKDETQVGVSEDQKSPCPDNSSLSNVVVNAGTVEADAVNENAANLDQKAEVVENSKEESSQSTIEVRADKNLDQRAGAVEVGKGENAKSVIQFKRKNLDQRAEVIEVVVDDTLNSGEGNEVEDSKTDDDTRSGDTEIAEEEIDVIDKPEEPDTEEIMEQPSDSFQEASDGDHVMDEKTGNETEVINLSILPESSTVASLELEEVDVEVVEEKGSEGKDEAEDVSVEPTMVVNAGTGEVADLSESSDQKVEVNATNKDESLLATIKVEEVTTAPVVSCIEPELSVVKMEIDTETSMAEPPAGDDASNKQSLVSSGNEIAVPEFGDTPIGEPQAYAEHGVLPADSAFPYEEGHVERGEDAGMDIDEVLGWKDEIKVDPTIFSLESEQWNETFASLQQSGYFQPPETEGEFSVSDLVWGKVRSHPWWPGQIFDPSDASEEAMKYHKEGCFLVAYFGDRTFAWNDSTDLKSFRSQFSEVEKHENSEAFSNAVHCALEEVSRRVELGLACSCIPQNICENIKYQIVENSGISLEASKRRCIDKSASVSSFEPHKLVDYMRLLATFPYGEVDKLELTLVKAQLSSFGRYKGYRQLAEFQLCGDLLEEDEIYSEDGSKKRKALDSISDGSEKRPTLHTDKPSFKVGACIQRVASQLTGPPLADHVAGSDVSMQSPGLSRLGNQAYEGELLSQLHLAAQDPMKGYSFLNTIIPFFNSHRSAVLSKSRQLANDARKRKVLNENDPEEFEFDDVNDSYWTDRIIQNPDENMLQDNQNGGEEQHQHQQHQLVSYEQQHQQQPVKQTRRSNKKRFFSSNHEIEAKEQSELIERRRQNLATEVLMKYTEGIYFPSEIHLNKMFKRFGPLMESETEVDRQSGRARVVFKKCSDAEVAHSSAGKFNIFGAINVNYELNYTPMISYKPLPLPFGQDPAC